MKPKTLIMPSILTTKYEEFERRLKFARSVTKAAQIDFIDGEFCDGITLPIEKWPSLGLEYSEAHLMVKRPIEYLERVAKLGVTRAVVHIEADFDLEELKLKARELDILLGFAINPETDLEKVRPFYQLSNYFLVMGVTPGSEGQLMHSTTPLAVSFLKKQPYRLIVGVDGGVNESTAKQLYQHGASYLVAGSALFADGDPEENYKNLLESLHDDDQGA